MVVSVRLIFYNHIPDNYRQFSCGCTNLFHSVTVHPNPPQITAASAYNEWELLGNYDNNPTTAHANITGLTGFWNTTTGYTWVATRCGAAVGNTCIATNASWTEASPGGYAIYYTSDWAASGYTTNSNLLDPGAPQPLLFLPAAGYRGVGGSVTNVGTGGIYWSSSISSTNAYLLRFYSTDVYPSYTNNRANGYSVRCVPE